MYLGVRWFDDNIHSDDAYVYPESSFSLVWFCVQIRVIPPHAVPMPNVPEETLLMVVLSVLAAPGLPEIPWFPVLVRTRAHRP